jgi:hypothetical protein
MSLHAIDFPMVTLDTGGARDADASGGSPGREKYYAGGSPAATTN